MKYDIFISYRRKENSGRSNVPMARTFKLEFERRGYKVFFDYSECTDNYFSQAILPAIRTCDYYVLILTEDCLSRCVNEGDWVRREIEEALAYNRKIIPITPDNECSSWPELPEPLRRLDGLQITTIHTDQMFEGCVNFLIKNRFHNDKVTSVRILDSQHKLKKTLWIAFGTVVALVLLVWLWSKPKQEQEPAPVSEGHTLAETDSMAFQNCQTVADYRRYIADYGQEAQHYAEAKDFIGRYEADSMQRVQDSLVQAQEQAEAEMKKEYEAYLICTNVTACNQYLNDYPQGRYVDEVRVKKEKMEKKKVKGVFSISALKKVLFAKGNLQYQPSTSTWRFAENQWDYIGMGNKKVSDSYSGWIDLFGWGTSGWNSGNVYYHPWDTIQGTWDDNVSELYGPVGDHSLTGTFANADWGVFNRISNGGNIVGKWRTLTQSEWYYLLFKRVTNSNILFVKAMVNDVKGVIILADDWDSDCYNLFNSNDASADYMDNTIMASEWNSIFETRAVFLPAAGSRSGTSIYDPGSCGRYWTASHKDAKFATRLCFAKDEFRIREGYYRSDGYSVRLVCPIE